MICEKFIEGGYKSASGQAIDSCLECGRTARSHDPKKACEPVYEIHWGGKVFTLSPDEAKNAGFHL